MPRVRRTTIQRATSILDPAECCSAFACQHLDGVCQLPRIPVESCPALIRAPITSGPPCGRPLVVQSGLLCLAPISTV